VNERRNPTRLLFTRFFPGMTVVAQRLWGRLALNRVSDNAGAVKHFLSVLLQALRKARHFALVEGPAIPTKARS
jgi:hypothetical protein